MSGWTIATFAMVTSTLIINVWLITQSHKRLRELKARRVPNVNVAGSVVTDRDLGEAIRRGLEG